jgi:hypothetical protein
MACSSYQEDAPRRSASIRRRWRRFAGAAAAGAAIGAVWAGPASAAGPLYAVPSHPPSESESVGFTNALNHRVRHLPAPLNPPAAQSPAEVEARVEALERGVVIAGTAARRKAAKKHAAAHSAPAGHQSSTVLVAANGPDDRAPLTIAFVAAGALALIGLLLVARQKYFRSPQGA